MQVILVQNAVEIKCPDPMGKKNDLMVKNQIAFESTWKNKRGW